MTKSVTILGATGSVGAATIDVVRYNPNEFKVKTLTAQTNVALLAEQAIASRADLAVIGQNEKYAELKDRLAGTGVAAAAGRAALIDAGGDGADITMAAIIGMAGLEPLLAAISRGNKVAIANKEPLVAAGALVMEAARKSGATILPVDSEHNAVFQVLEPENQDRVARLILTASGGPFRSWDVERMAAATPEQALKHPNWSMGAKITIDSATMMNKALEVIEAHFLFSAPPEKIEVLVHPQSIIHSMVEYMDGSVLAQMGAPDMRVPIAHALGWPKRIGGPATRLDLLAQTGLTFEPVDRGRFPAINLAYDCLGQGAAACIALNAANEVAVEMFLSKKIGFLDITRINRTVVETARSHPCADLESILAFDAKMRDSAKACIVAA